MNLEQLFCKHPSTRKRILIPASWLRNRIIKPVVCTFPSSPDFSVSSVAHVVLVACPWPRKGLFSFGGQSEVCVAAGPLDILVTCALQGQFHINQNWHSA